MERFIKGDIVVVPFPFSNLTISKRRPALVISALSGDDLILCQITSQNIRDEYAVALDIVDFDSGGLNKFSNIRPNRLFMADHNIVLYKVGHLKSAKLSFVLEALFDILMN